MARRISRNKNYSKSKPKSHDKKPMPKKVPEPVTEKTREEDNILYKVKDLYLGYVGYYDNNGVDIEDIHVFTNVSEEQAFDLNSNSIIFSKGTGRVFFYKSLISFEFLTMKSRINYVAFHRKNALTSSYYYKDLYKKFLSIKNITPYTLELGLKR